VSTRNGDFAQLLAEMNTPYLNTGMAKKIIYLREDGEDIRGKKFDTDNFLFVLGDHEGLTNDEEKIILEHEHEIVSVSPLSLHAEHCIVLLHNEMDRAEKRK
jgi:tRNA (pseudouridine54-N1)-methyltransferase